MQTDPVAAEYRTPSPSWGNRAAREPRWPASIAIGAALVLYVLLPDKLIYGPFGLSPTIARWFVPALEVALLLPLQLTAPHRHLEEEETPWRRITSISLIGLVNLVNLGSLILLVDHLLHGKLAHSGSTGVQLIYSAILIWLTNVIIFGLWYWELDRGGP